MTIQPLALALILLAQDTNDPIVQFGFESQGQTYNYIITEGMLDKSPAWTNSDNPPLSLKSAEAIAQKYAAKEWPSQKLKVMTISLIWAKLVDRWYYEIIMESPDPMEGPGSTYEVVILMDGTIVEPVKSK
ncbi:MAG: hypothetical protein LV481_04140 [Methylacidiphilales bacterium]|nr:hypothetical protein [Candidatus Methylacidiphilales bacterium]